MARGGATGGRLRALQAAQRTLDDLGLDLTQRIDVFAAVARLGLWVSFLPLQNLLGAVVPEGDGGVLITTERSAAVQRYTAAHEIGHWILDQDQLALDGEREILGTSPIERERQAQIFAGYFLMPPPLIHGTAARHGIRRKTVPTPAQVYLTARDTGASYEAVARQLQNLDYYPWSVLTSLLKVRPLTAKKEAAYGLRPRDGHADVWPVEPYQAAEHLDVEVGDEIVLNLPENRTTGYRWLTEDEEIARRHRQPHPAPAPLTGPPARSPQPPPPARRPPRPAAATRDALQLLPSPEVSGKVSAAETDAPLAVVEDQFRPGWATLSRPDLTNLRRLTAGDKTADLPAPAAEVATTRDTGPAVPIGATGRRILAVLAGAEGEATVRLSLASPHDPAGDPVAVFSLTSTARLRPAALRKRRLLDVDIDERVPGDPPDDAEFLVIGATEPGHQEHT
ncbi:MAG TPA: ImmA/IrrE family metallo-endopeptidase [Frankiaceae bacterium]|nr:ImmA/IrrE family metallo-endopeptidase [Frankiaceae bacterium]